MKNTGRYRPTPKNMQEVRANVVDYVAEPLDDDNKWLTSSTYRLYLITKGKGRFVTGNANILVEAGDLLLIKPDRQYYMRAKGEFMYQYVSFEGEYCEELIRHISFTPNGHFRRYGKTELCDVWEQAHGASNNTNAPIVGAGVLFYTLGILTEQRKEEKTSRTTDCIRYVCHCMEERFSEPTLSLSSLCKELGYSDKYISALFHRVMGMTFSKYLAKVRMAHALRMIEDGYTSVKDIALQSGIVDPMYFARMCRKRLGKSPTELIRDSASLRAAFPK